MILDELGLEIPDEYLRLLRITNGIETQRGYLSSLQDLGEQNAITWFLNTVTDPDSEVFAIKYVPLEKPRTPTYIWLGYDGNMFAQIYDLSSKEFRQTELDGTGSPRNRDRSLAGLLRRMIYGDE